MRRTQVSLPTFVLVPLLLLLFLVGSGSKALAALSPTDDTSLTLCLESISHGWVQPAVDLSNTILTRPQYSVADWTAWFDKYFNTTQHPYTEDLHFYLELIHK